MLSPGEILKQAREKRGWSIEEAASATCISRSHIRHLENNQFDEFQDVFARGFIRNYARELGCDPYMVILAFDRLRMQESQEIVISSEKSNSKPVKKGRPIHFLLAFVFILATIAAIGLAASSKAIAKDPASFENTKAQSWEMEDDVQKTRWLLERPESDPDRIQR